MRFYQQELCASPLAPAHPGQRKPLVTFVTIARAPKVDKHCVARNLP